MKKLITLIILFLIQPVWAEKNVPDELDATWDKIKKTISTGDYHSYKSFYHRDAVLVNGMKNNSYPIKNAFSEWRQGFDDTK